MKSFIKLIFESNEKLAVSNILLHKGLLNPFKINFDANANLFLNKIKGINQNFKSILILQANILNYVIYNSNL